MKIENQVVSLKLAKELKANGYKQEGLWWWRVYIKSNEATLTMDDYCKSNPKDYIHYVAPTVAELGKKLPNKIKCPIGKAELFLQKEFVYYAKKLKHIAIVCSELATTEAEARAKMWLYLKKEKLI